LNIPRISQRDALSVMQGIGYAKSGDLPLLLFDALSMTTDEAELRQDDYVADRAAEDALREARG
jgi:hypothetical protein